MYEPIINREQLLEDMQEGIAQILDLSILDIDEVTDDDIEQTIDAMFEAEAEELYKIAERIRIQRI